MIIVIILLIIALLLMFFCEVERQIEMEAEAELVSLDEIEVTMSSFRAGSIRRII
jgi:hypothetical protein